jgi:hypothetical protein
LGVKTTFPKAMYSAHFISEAISKDICAQLAREVVSLVPQVVDYTCAICKYCPSRHEGAGRLIIVVRHVPLLAAHPAGLRPLVLHPVHDQDAEPEQAILPALPSRRGSEGQRKYVFVNPSVCRGTALVTDTASPH